MRQSEVKELCGLEVSVQVFREVVYFAPGVRGGGELERLAFQRRTQLVPQRLGFSGSHGEEMTEAGKKDSQERK